MRVLAFDTSGPHVAACLISGGETFVHVEDMARGQAERLMPCLEERLAAQNLAWADLDAIGVGVGPGNFTGIRISVAAARGLSLSLGIPAIGVSLFDTTQKLSNWAQTWVPAPRDQAYLWDPEKLAAPVLASEIPKSSFAAAADHIIADHVAEMARQAKARIGEDVGRPKPLYVKPPDAAPGKAKPVEITP